MGNPVGPPPQPSARARSVAIDALPHPMGRPLGPPAKPAFASIRSASSSVAVGVVAPREHFTADRPCAWRAAPGGTHGSLRIVGPDCPNRGGHCRCRRAHGGDPWGRKRLVYWPAPAFWWPPELGPRTWSELALFTSARRAGVASSGLTCNHGRRGATLALGLIEVAERLVTVGARSALVRPATPGTPAPRPWRR